LATVTDEGEQVEIYSVLPQRVPSDEPQPAQLEAATVGCAVYVDGARLPDVLDCEAALAAARRHRAEGRDAFAWIGLHEPDRAQMAVAADVFDLHPLVVARVAHDRRRPSLHQYDDVLVLTLKTLHYVECDASSAGASEVVEFGEVMVAVRADFVLTVRKGPHGELAELRGRMDESPNALRLGPYAVMHGVADHVVSAYRQVVDRIQNDVDALEADVFAAGVGVDLERAYLLKGEVAAMRHAIAPLTVELARVLSQPDDLVSTEVRRFLRDVLDRAQQLSDRIEVSDEVLDSLWEATLGRIAVQQNEDVRKISAWVALAAVPTMLAAIYGMNFDDMPELHWAWGYPAVLGVMVTVSGFLYWRFRRVRWL
jgi:magnesium transporter